MANEFIVRPPFKIPLKNKASNLRRIHPRNKAMQQALAQTAHRAYEKGIEELYKGEGILATQYFTDAVQYWPNFPEAQEALRILEKEESQALYKQGLEAFLDGQYSKAKEFWKRALEKDPTHSSAKRALERLQ